MSTVMELPELLKKRAEKLLFTFCQQAADDEFRPRHIRYRIEGLHINLYEVRRSAQNPEQHKQLPMAKLRYSPELNQWTLHHQNGEHWQLYLNITPTLELSKLFSAIQQDPLGFFWQE
ncbi:MAG: DUF3024 domain-containing protein [Desulfuromonadaceae bacterium]|nr:DUF3024 domain-containing protein [Desulfuromonadaceae bacterium]